MYHVLAATVLLLLLMNFRQLYLLFACCASMYISPCTPCSQLAACDSCSGSLDNLNIFSTNTIIAACYVTNNGHVEALLPPDNFTRMLHFMSMVIAQSGLPWQFNGDSYRSFEEALKYHFKACHTYLCFQTVICILVSTLLG